MWGFRRHPVMRRGEKSLRQKHKGSPWQQEEGKKAKCSPVSGVRAYSSIKAREGQLLGKAGEQHTEGTGRSFVALPCQSMLTRIGQRTSRVGIAPFLWGDG